MNADAPFLSRWKFTIAGLAITPVAILAFFASAGAGHGDYVWAKIIFPVLATLIVIDARFVPGPGPIITDIALAICVLQFVAYGFALDSIGSPRNRLVVGVTLGLFHLTLAALLLRYVAWPD